MHLTRAINEYADQLPPGYVHVSAYAERHKIPAQKMSAMAARSPQTIRIGNYLFIPESTVVRVSQTWTPAGKLVDRYSMNPRKRRAGAA